MLDAVAALLPSMLPVFFSSSLAPSLSPGLVSLSPRALSLDAQRTALFLDLISRLFSQRKREVEERWKRKKGEFFLFDDGKSRDVKTIGKALLVAAGSFVPPLSLSALFSGARGDRERHAARLKRGLWEVYEKERRLFFRRSPRTSCEGGLPFSSSSFFSF